MQEINGREFLNLTAIAGASIVATPQSITGESYYILKFLTGLFEPNYCILFVSIVIIPLVLPGISDTTITRCYVI